MEPDSHSASEQGNQDQGAKETVVRISTRIADVPAQASIPVFADKERWQVWVKSA